MKFLKLNLILLLIILLISTSTRLTLLKTYFGHIDDLGVATTILDAKRYPPTVDSLLAEGQLRAINKGTTSSRLRALVQITENPLGKKILEFLLPIYPYVAVPLVWTYAPLQFIFTSLLVNPEQSYETVKFWGRFPSLISATSALFFMMALAREIQPQQWTTLGVLLVAPLAFSLEISVMTAQMHNYALGVAVATGVLYLTVKDAKRVLDFTGWRFWLSRFFIWTLALYSIYQSVLLLPGYFIAQLVASWHLPSHQRWARIRKWCVWSMVIVLVFLPAYLFRVRTTAAIGWNAGPNQEFLFQPEGSFLLSSLQYFAVNGFIVVGSMLSPAIESSIAFYVWTYLFCVFALIGLLGLLASLFRKDTTNPLKALSCIILGGLVVLVILTLGQKLVLSPTRHLTLFAPILTVLFAYGVGVAISTHKQNWLSMVVFIISVALGLTYLTNFPHFKAAKQDLFSEKTLVNLVETEHADLIIAMSREALLMPSLRTKVPVLDMSKSGQYYKLGFSTTINLSLKPQRILFIGQRPIAEKECQNVKDFIQTAVSTQFDCHALRPLMNQQTDVEVEFSQRTLNGSKSLYVALFEQLSP